MFALMLTATLLVCLLVSAVVVLYVAYPGRDRPLPEAVLSRVPARMRRSRRVESSPQRPREVHEVRS